MALKNTYKKYSYTAIHTRLFINTEKQVIDILWKNLYFYELLLYMYNTSIIFVIVYLQFIVFLTTLITSK